MTWERRFVAGRKVERSEAGSWQFPLALDCLYELDIPTPSLQQLLQPWVYAESMRSGFLSAGPLKCVYIDRLVMLTKFLGHNNVLELESELNLPFFEDDRTAEITWIPHRPVSGVVHLGSHSSGHFVTFLKACNPDSWYEMDDEKPAKVHQVLPTWAKQRLVLVWLCPTNCALDTSFPTLQERLGLVPGPSRIPSGDLPTEPLGTYQDLPEEEQETATETTAAWPQIDDDEPPDDAQRLALLLARINDALLPPETCALQRLSGADAAPADD